LFAALYFNRFFTHVHYRFSYTLEHLKLHFTQCKISSTYTVPYESTSCLKNLSFSYENCWPSSSCTVYPRLPCLVSAPEDKIIILLDAVQLLISVCRGTEVTGSKNCVS
jgi:hypothetical protein